MKLIIYLFIPFLSILSFLYGIVIEIRNILYNLNFLKVYSFNKPIISIGNITIGGTGKTPLTIYIAKYILNQGKRPGIISRGYGRISKDMIIVHNGKEMLVDVKTAGDEPYLIGKKLESVPIVVSHKKQEGIKVLFNNFDVDVVIMDDGFQGRNINRNLDILTVSGIERKQNYHLLPWGKMRESFHNIKRAHLIIYTKSNAIPNIHKKIKIFGVKDFIISHYESKLFYYNSNNLNKIKIFKEPVYAFCGIGDYKSFFNSLIELGINIEKKEYFSDHQNYSDRIIKKIYNKVKKLKLKKVVTTEKDLVKLPQFFIDSFQIYVVKISINIVDNFVLTSKINKLFNK